MRRTVIAGLILAAATGALIALSDPLGLNVENVAVLGVALGAILGLVGDRPGWERVAGFGVGLVVAWLAYGLRAGYLPDATAGRVVAAVGAFALLVLVAWLSANRVELWTMLVGVAALVGAYEVTYVASPPRFMQESPVAVTSVLLGVAIGFAVAALVSTWVGPDAPSARHRDDSPGDAPDESEVPFDDMFRQDEEVRP